MPVDDGESRSRRRRTRSQLAKNEVAQIVERELARRAQAEELFRDILRPGPRYLRLKTEHELFEALRPAAPTEIASAAAPRCYATNVVPIIKDRNPPARPARARPTGKRPEKKDAAIKAMLDDLRSGRIMPADLNCMYGKELEGLYVGKRTMLCEAREEALRQFQSRQVATNDK